MNLFEALETVTRWDYYRKNDENGLGCNPQRYSSIINDPCQFITDYFYNGGKHDFWTGTIADDDSDEAKARASHVVNTYFLGLYLADKIDYLKPHGETLLARNDNFLWAWYLCALYHDAAFTKEELGGEERPKYLYCNGNERFLYHKKTIENYYKKNENPETSFDGHKHHDHGILAAEMLFDRFLSTIQEQIRQGGDIRDIFSENGLRVGDNHLIINMDSIESIYKIAKIIACHNIFVCDKEDDVQKYRDSNLMNLVPQELGGNRFEKMPHRHFGFMDDFDKLYYLLALVDTLEPVKKEINYYDIDIEVSRTLIKGFQIDIRYNGNDENKKEKYFNNVLSLNTWLRFVEVRSIDDKSLAIHLEFQDKSGFMIGRRQQ